MQSNINQLTVSEDQKVIRNIQKKIVILGEGGVGKTTLLHRTVSNIFVDSTKMTIGSDFFMKKIEKTDEKNINHINLLLWDFAGQERFRFILKDYVRGAEGVVLCFDLARLPTLKRLYDWIDILKEGGVWGNKNVKFFLVGTKEDLVSNNSIAISPDEIEQCKNDFNIDYFIKTSALNSNGVEELFNEIGNRMLK
ncbi:GTP-binding protein [Promethearchaeum syntrophicum]|uniref:GTP-binding protein n=1 Tax=Promethearchaeum syntrophicum TaxID=2594042 RepID=A0A5B9DE64_9ARCH|nr:Rab family GTPase [Candidatus Prometheoarchaeum syntrophicum]QEE17063.1 Ras family protein [Candidatus Prometheoarchaeum syntrophicum]